MRLLIYAIIGLVVGAFILHPLFMLINQFSIGDMQFDLDFFFSSFSQKHSLMKIYFSILGITIAILQAIYIDKLIKKTKRINKLEGILPLCSYCKKIHIVSNKEEQKEKWINLEDYLRKNTDLKLSHGICPQCALGISEKYEISNYSI